MGLRIKSLRDYTLDKEIIEVEDDRGKTLVTLDFVEEMTEEKIMSMPCLLMTEEECQETKRRLIELLRHLKTQSL
jgi:hypothetical protein